MLTIIMVERKYTREDSRKVIYFHETDIVKKWLLYEISRVMWFTHEKSLVSISYRADQELLLGGGANPWGGAPT